MTAEYYQKHKAECLLRSQQWAANNRERLRLYQREYQRKWKKANRDKCNLTKRRWIAKNPEKAKEGEQKWRQANKERVRISHRRACAKYDAAHPEVGRMRQHRRRERERSVKSCDKQSRNVLCQLISDASRLTCGICGKNMPKNDRVIDHIIPLSKGGSGEIWNLRIVHMQCNLEKAYKMPDELNFHTP